MQGRRLKRGLNLLGNAWFRWPLAMSDPSRAETKLSDGSQSHPNSGLHREDIGGFRHLGSACQGSFWDRMRRRPRAAVFDKRSESRDPISGRRHDLGALPILGATP
jgi:hypothetical protein